jgi:putative cardiolipin synthase
MSDIAAQFLEFAGWTIAIVGAIAAAAALLAISGRYLGDRLAPKRHDSTPVTRLPAQESATAFDRLLAPARAAHPERSGAQLLTRGDDAFKARVYAARGAERSLDLLYYMWKSDKYGDFLVREAFKAAERGVRVRLLIDDINVSGLDEWLLALDRHPNVEIRIHNPLSARSGVSRLFEMVQRVYAINHRMHNKCWIADGRIALVGGRNIGAEYFDAGRDKNFRDLDLLIVGPAVDQAGDIFDAYWNCKSVIPIRALSHEAPLREDEKRQVFADAARDIADDIGELNPSAETGNPALALFAGNLGALHWCEQLRIVSDPPFKWREKRNPQWLVFVLTDVLRSAKRDAFLVSPYFVPGGRFLRVLKRLRKKGVKVSVVTNSLAATDVVAVHGGYSSYRRRLLRAGVRLFEMRASIHEATSEEPKSKHNGILGSKGASLHTKAFAVDDSIGFVGSFNLDPRSAKLNTEMGALFTAPSLAAELRAHLEASARPEISYETRLGRAGHLYWLDGEGPAQKRLDTEPESSFWRRMGARACRALPIEAAL